MLEALGTVAHYLGRIVTTAAAALIIYIAFKLTRKTFNAYQEVLVMWTVAFGRRWMPRDKSLRIQPYLCRTEHLDDVSIDECFRFHCEAFQPAAEDISAEEMFAMYKRVLLSYSHVLFCREKLDGSLRGLVLLGVDRKEKYTVLKMGLMLTQKNYRGGPWIKLIVACLFLKELILHPFVPAYLVAKVSTYRAYILSTIFPDSHPRYDKEAPEEYKKVAEDFVNSVRTPLDYYDRDTFVLHRRVGVVQKSMANISQRDLQNPHIKFFQERNPGWIKGDQLVTMVRMTWRALLLNFARVILRQFKPSRSQSSNVPRGNAAAGNVNRKKAAKLHTRLARGNTYQDMEAALHSIRFNPDQERNEDENGAVVKLNSSIQRLYSHSDDEDLNIDL